MINLIGNNNFTVKFKSEYISSIPHNIPIQQQIVELTDLQSKKVIQINGKKLKDLISLLQKANEEFNINQELKIKL